MITSDSQPKVCPTSGGSNDLANCTDYGTAYQIGRRAGEAHNGESNPFEGGHPDAIKGWNDGRYDGWSSHQIGGHRQERR